MKYRLYYHEDTDKYVSAGLIDKYEYLGMTIVTEKDLKIGPDLEVKTDDIADFIGFDPDELTFEMEDDGKFYVEELTEDTDTFHLTPQGVMGACLSDLSLVNSPFDKIVNVVFELFESRLEKQGYCIALQSKCTKNV